MLGTGQKAMHDQAVQGLGRKVAPRDPGNHLQVAQAAGPFLDIGFQVIGRVVVALVALDLFFVLGLEEGLGRPDFLRRRQFQHLHQQVDGAGQQARFHQCRCCHHVGLCILGALGDRSHTVPEVETGIPQQLHESLDLLARKALADVVFQQDQQIHIGGGV